MLELTLGPVAFYWTRDRYADFYAQAGEWPIETVYLGETVCSRRRDMKLDDWRDIARSLTERGKRVVLSSQTLIESEADLRGLRKVCDNGDFMVEANDHSAVRLLADAGVPFVAGPAINLYNAAALGVMAKAGMQRWVMPVEMARDALANLLTARDAAGLDAPCEVFAYGHLPLAWSARCFTARRHGLPKDRCQFVCQQYPEGLPLCAQDAPDEVFTLNGIQTLSGACQDLRHEVPEMQRMGVAAARLSPRAEGMSEVVAAFDRARRGELAERDPLALTEVGCDGYWHGQAGMKRTALQATPT
ncbi:U32 family peptidase [Litchfieldella xinjiangensis]|uniref:U32 family peptidase n=1 Tax=Litchfieldella xinjiangensis TaxID=1166948 RepID=UPI0005B994D4|nr:U32 family peptidase [Halomonas xinjiangensis]